MADDKNSVIDIFHFDVLGKYSLIVHPFYDQEIFASLEEKDACVFYGSEPDIAFLAAFRNWMYGLADSYIREWVAEKFFLSRFLLASLVFVVVYFFLGFVIRDPIPFVDEFIGAVVISVIVFFYLYRKDRSAYPVLERKSLFIKRIDSIKFFPSSFTSDVEKAVNNFMTSDFEKWEDFILNISDLKKQKEDKFPSLLNNLEVMLSKNPHKKNFSVMKKLYKKKDYFAVRAFLLSLDKKDAFLLSLYFAALEADREVLNIRTV
ncbi:hypothetical protein WKV44_04910 [Spirochaetia bacterium 38H-sp]|uniref:Uncharacterized protein n=1 Tax=Rarispira pelagica TaxID=3141764 RepID=A0ABU9UB25_9SPIR